MPWKLLCYLSFALFMTSLSEFMIGVSVRTVKMVTTKSNEKRSVVALLFSEYHVVVLPIPLYCIVIASISQSLFLFILVLKFFSLFNIVFMKNHHLYGFVIYHVYSTYAVFLFLIEITFI